MPYYEDSEPCCLGYKSVVLYDLKLEV